MADTTEQLRDRNQATGNKQSDRILEPATTLSVVIPAFNEEAVLEQLFVTLSNSLEKQPCQYEVIVVDDGSVDRTWPILNELHQRDPRWKAIRLGRNFGHQIALRAGLDIAQGQIVGVIDADLQDPPEILVKMLERWCLGDDVVVGVRTRRKEDTLKRTSYYLFYRLLALVADLKMPLDAGDFCIMDRSVVSIIKMMPERRPFIRGLRSWVGFKQSLFPYERQVRRMGETKYSYNRLFALAIDGILSNSRIPLHIATFLGAATSVFAFLGGIVVLIIRLAPSLGEAIGIEYVPGTASVILSVLLMGGIQLLCLGIIGTYIGRIQENVMQRPLWTVQGSLGFEKLPAFPTPKAAFVSNPSSS